MMIFLSKNEISILTGVSLGHAIDQIIEKLCPNIRKYIIRLILIFPSVEYKDIY